MPSAIFMGTKPAAVIALRYLIEMGWSIPAVIIPKNHSAEWLPKPSLEDYCLSQKIPVYKSQLDLPDTSVDYVFSYMYRNLVKDRILKMARHAALNFHPAPLPKFGGFAFYNVAILEECVEYGCTCHFMDNAFDTGDLLKVKKFKISSEKETAFTLERKTQRVMLGMFYEIISSITDGLKLTGLPQNKLSHRYLTLEEFENLKKIPSDASEWEIEKIARAFWFPPYLGAYQENDGGHKAFVVPQCVLPDLSKILHLNDFDTFKIK